MDVDRYVFMYVRELHVYVKSLISDLRSEWFKMRHHLEREILVSQSQILDREPSLKITICPIPTLRNNFLIVCLSKGPVLCDDRKWQPKYNPTTLRTIVPLTINVTTCWLPSKFLDNIWQLHLVIFIAKVESCLSCRFLWYQSKTMSRNYDYILWQPQ
jgi:hypothetical protein